MTSHDNLTWGPQIFRALRKESNDREDHLIRLVSYLPLSHTAGIAFDLAS